jgi:hypothetical protein
MIEPDARFCAECGAENRSEIGVTRPEADAVPGLQKGERIVDAENVERARYKEGIKPIHVIGGTVVVSLILLGALAPRIMRFLGPSETPLLSQSQKAEIPEPSGATVPGSAELRTSTELPETTVPRISSTPTKQEPDFALPPFPSGAVVTKATRAPSETEKQSSLGTIGQRSEAMKRADQSSTPGATQTIESRLPKQKAVGREGLGDQTEKSPPFRETPIPRRPAEPGSYETIRVTAARITPSDSGDVVDQLTSGTRLNVAGSQGDWLIVYSRTRNRRVYVKRDDAMFVAERAAASPSATYSEVKQKEVESQIQQAIATRGLTGVTVSFIGDTAYLKGIVATDDQRFSAELAARSFPEVTHIHNGISVRP